MGATSGKASLTGSLFDHSPMAPPIVHPVKVSITAGYLLGPGTLDKGGDGLSRPGGNLGLGFRIQDLGEVCGSCTCRL